ncbi:Calpain-9 [Galemys pyrenaicus]|uniref:Calpain-9 n=1 Tax=Galemys pyrenaicus TaxID=202257 RepID=A0A8J6DML3_GALPY|nr:Calpain-9 [Galemys pyrenaicus]
MFFGPEIELAQPTAPRGLQAPWGGWGWFSLRLPSGRAPWAGREVPANRPEAHGQLGRAMPYLYQASGPREPPAPKDARTTHSSGQSFEQLRQGCLQRGVLFEDPDFPASSSSLFYSERPQIPFVWKRPGEIVQNPEFILGGATRTDICQGELDTDVATSGMPACPLGRELSVSPISGENCDFRICLTGDCWLLAAIASLTLNEKALARVVPQDQNFGSGYAGIFHFQFWQHSEWLDVVVDDRLPTFRDRLVFLHSADDNEFWSALLEKAYAKLNGSYEALKGGSAIEAMEDFTGGVAETFTTREAPENFYEILEKALKRGSLVGCSIDVRNTTESEARTPFGLIKGHAYTVTGIDQVNLRGKKTELIRVRNPWGQVEWNGAWSDSSSEWRSVGLAEQTRLCHAALDDGEFWYRSCLFISVLAAQEDRSSVTNYWLMSEWVMLSDPSKVRISALRCRMAFADFKAHFDKVEICNLTPDALEEDALHKWEVTVHQGSWVRGSTAGGCRNFLDTFWTNPQIKLCLTEKDEEQEGCTLLVALMQKDRRKLKRFGADMLTIGYAIYQCPGKDEHLNKDFFRYHASQARSKTFINLREVSDRFRLAPGEYILIPSTFEPHQEADFCLRIFSEKKAITQDMDGNVDIELPEETEEEQQFRALFERIAGEDMEVTAEELEYVLNTVLQKKKDIQFKKLSLISCKNIISLMDVSFPKYSWCNKQTMSLAVRIHVTRITRHPCQPTLPPSEIPGRNTLASSFLNSPPTQTSGNGKLEFDEFKVFWDKLKEWIFTPRLRGRCPEVYPLGSAPGLRRHLFPAGFQLSSQLLQLIVLRYADEELQLGFDDFLNCLVRLENASRECALGPESAAVSVHWGRSARPGRLVLYPAAPRGELAEEETLSKDCPGVFQALHTKNEESIHLRINEVGPRQVPTFTGNTESAPGCPGCAVRGRCAAGQTCDRLAGALRSSCQLSSVRWVTGEQSTVVPEPGPPAKYQMGAVRALAPLQWAEAGACYDVPGPFPA